MLYAHASTTAKGAQPGSHHDLKELLDKTRNAFFKDTAALSHLVEITCTVRKKKREGK